MLNIFRIATTLIQPLQRAESGSLNGISLKEIPSFHQTTTYPCISLHNGGKSAAGYPDESLAQGCQGEREAIEDEIVSEQALTGFLS